MNTQAVLENARQLLMVWTKETTTPEANRLDVNVLSSDLHFAVAALQNARWGYLAAITGLDSPTTNKLQVLYHFCSGAAVVTLRVIVPRDNAQVPSICDIISSARVFEREVMEMFGVTIVGTPDTARLLLPDDWTDGEYPLRKDFVAEKA